MAVTHRNDISVDLVVAECEARSIEFYRFNTEDFPRQIRIAVSPAEPMSAVLMTEQGDIDLGGGGIWIWRPEWPTFPDDITDVFDLQLARQESVAALAGVLRLLANRCVSPPDAMQAARWKIPQLKLASDLGFLVPQTMVTSDPDSARRFTATAPTVLKAVADARVRINGEVWVGSAAAIASFADWSTAVVAPVLLQRQIDKEFDLRITVVGSDLYAVKISAPPDTGVDVRDADPEDCAYEPFDVEPRLAEKCLQFLDRMGLRYGAFDFAADPAGDIWFLECNPAGQWGWLEHYTGLPITSSLVDLLISL